MQQGQNSNTKSLYTMKKRISNILGTICIVAVFAACLITNKQGDPCKWNYICLAIAGISGYASKKVEEAK